MEFIRSGRNPLRTPMRKQRYSSGRIFHLHTKINRGVFIIIHIRRKRRRNIRFILRQRIPWREAQLRYPLCFHRKSEVKPISWLIPGKHSFSRKHTHLQALWYSCGRHRGGGCFWALLYGWFRLAFCLYRQDGKKGLIRYRFEGLTVYHLVFIQESQDLRFWAAVWYAFIWEICLCKMQESYSVFHFLQLHLHWQSWLCMNMWSVSL